MRLFRRAAVAASIIPALALFQVGCRREQTPNAAERGAMTGFRGITLSSPLPKPSFILTDQNGKAYDFGKETQGKVALLFFGYTHCPDVCPLHMANIAAVLRTMPFEERDAVRVVFVTTDPARDTPARLKEWLGAIDPTFIGLTGTHATIDSAQRSLGLRVAEKEYAERADSANYFVGHAAQVFAFARDGNAYLIYPNGIRQQDWAQDLPKLARDASGAATRAEVAAMAGGSGSIAIAPPEASVTMRGFEVPVAVIAQPLTRSEAALYLTVRNGTPQDDELIGISTAVAGMASLHDSFSGGKMAAIAGAPIPRGGELRLEPGGRHGMLMGLTRDLKAGDTVFVVLTLKRAGALEAAAIVVPYAGVQRALTGGVR
jgi:cytochrome oxidase Cu insertion factor (SCO1/SenC/PrrC family)